MSLIILKEHHRALTPASGQTPAFSTVESVRGFLEVRKFVRERNEILFDSVILKNSTGCCVADDD